MTPCEYVQVERGNAQPEGRGEWNGQVRVPISAAAQAGAVTLFICEMVILVATGHSVLRTIYIISDPDRNEGMVSAVGPVTRLSPVRAGGK